MTVTEPCGCKHNGDAWLSKCHLHSAQDRQTDARWAADHVRANPGTRFTAEYLALAREHEPNLRLHGGTLVENLAQCQASDWLDNVAGDDWLSLPGESPRG